MARPKKLDTMLKKLNLDLMCEATDAVTDEPVYVLEDERGATHPYTYQEIVKLYEQAQRKESTNA